MTGVETIARIRFEHFQKGKGTSVLRTSSGWRATRYARCCARATEFVYKREVHPQRKLGAWVETLTQNKGYDILSELPPFSVRCLPIAYPSR
jgi:hypothetical protein